MRQHQINLICGLAALGIGIGYGLCIPLQVSDFSEGYNISGRTLPYILTIIMILCGAALTVSAVKARAKLSASDRNSEKGCKCTGWKAHLRVVLYVLLVGGYVLGLSHIGLITSTFVVLLLAMFLSGAKNPVRSILISAVVSVSLYCFFTLLMDVYFPEGILW